MLQDKMREHMHLQARQRVADVFQGPLIYNSVICHTVVI